MRISYAKFLALLERHRIKRLIIYGDLRTAIVEVRGCVNSFAKFVQCRMHACSTTAAECVAHQAPHHLRRHAHSNRGGGAAAELSAKGFTALHAAHHHRALHVKCQLRQDV
jgi:hypothetical protein